MPGDRSDCPAAHVLDIVSDRWFLLIIRGIEIFGKKSFSEISATPEHIPPSTLTSSLELFLCDRLITKTLVPGGRGRQYSFELTDRRADLLPLIAMMFRWSAQYNRETPLSPAVRKCLENDIDGVVESWRSISGG
ncbi:MAG: winged helix-turn-helix transcriptional regulator [Gammaproteobacteria bacterium]